MKTIIILIMFLVTSTNAQMIKLTAMNGYFYDKSTNTTKTFSTTIPIIIYENYIHIGKNVFTATNMLEDDIKNYSLTYLVKDEDGADYLLKIKIDDGVIVVAIKSDSQLLLYFCKLETIIR